MFNLLYLQNREHANEDEIMHVISRNRETSLFLDPQQLNTFYNMPQQTTGTLLQRAFNVNEGDITHAPQYSANDWPSIFANAQGFNTFHNPPEQNTVEERFYIDNRSTLNDSGIYAIYPVNRNVNISTTTMETTGIAEVTTQEHTRIEEESSNSDGRPTMPPYYVSDVIHQPDMIPQVHQEMSGSLPPNYDSIMNSDGEPPSYDMLFGSGCMKNTESQTWLNCWEKMGHLLYHFLHNIGLFTLCTLAVNMNCLKKIPMYVMLVSVVLCALGY